MRDAVRMADNDRTPEQLVAQARDIAIALATAQISKVDAMANLEAIDLFESNEDDTNLHYAVVRVLTAALAAMAEHLADADGRSEDRKRELAAQFVQVSVDGLIFHSHPRDED